MGVDKAQVSRWLGAPGNLTIDTVAKIMFAINGSFVAVATIDPNAQGLANFTQPSWVVGKFPPLPTTAKSNNAVIAVTPRNSVDQVQQRMNWPINSSKGQVQNHSTVRIAAE
jgi:hypothetical protein